jgi:isopenicillin N synthase-like dioxygenase
VIPVISIESLLSGSAPSGDVAAELHSACCTHGFFYVSDHGVDPALIGELDQLARQFFALPESEKEAIGMAQAGLAWRGWFPLRGELTAGVPDEKEGIYFGTELGDGDERVQRGLPMHGANLFPDRPADLRHAVLSYMEQLTSVAQAILGGLAVGLGLPGDWFVQRLTADPLVLFRIFRYPPLPSSQSWSVGEHTDYGLLTILGQDGNGGLQVHTPGGWTDAPPIEGTFVCNLGDMLERLTGGLYRSTPHRVRNSADRDRLSFPFFLDPSWDATVERLPIVERPTDDDGASRWDHVSVHGFTGTYGDYITSKVGRVFPALADQG